MKIEKDKVVTISYNLNAEDEAGNKHHIEEVNKEKPVTFLFGNSGFPEKFEDELDGLSVDEPFEFKLSVEDAYGNVDEQSIVRLPKDIFHENGKFDDSRFQIGTIVPMTDADGHVMPSKILEIAQNDLLMDFNHPLAGLILHFTGNILDIRSATSEELSHGHVHGPGGHHHH